MNIKKYITELLGTFIVVFIGCGVAIFVGGSYDLGDGRVIIALSVGFSVIFLNYSFAGISGCHINPAISIALTISGKLSFRTCINYVLFQLIGALLAGGILYIIVSGNQLTGVVSQFAANGYGINSPGGYPLTNVFLMELIASAILVLVFILSNSNQSPIGMGGLTIGLCYNALYFLLLPISNASLNPVRSIAAAIISNKWAIDQLWLFIVVPIIGGIIGATLYNVIQPKTH